MATCLKSQRQLFPKQLFIGLKRYSPLFIDSSKVAMSQNFLIPFSKGRSAGIIG